jgi:beta-fructofuranosidase
MPDRDWRPKFHIQPPTGWLNDPNGSCFFGGKYHIYFQYTPENPNGGNKSWGHYESSDLAHFTYVDTPLKPDEDFDINGVYSGTAWEENGTLELYYTGNVKHPGDYDYINEGRGHNVIRVTTEDCRNYTEKELLLENSDYPENLSCHVRDPKIFKSDKDDNYYMLLGARTRDSHGGLLFMKSSDRQTWKTDLLFCPEGFGYMLECPDFFTLDRKNGQTGVVSFCPQGLESEESKFQNIYQSGYCLLNDEIIDKARDGLDDENHVLYSTLKNCITVEHFTEWDMGFDFYAPQVFVVPDGRRILIGWAGVPDASYQNTLTVQQGWQHCMTVCRELRLSNAKIYQTPVRELEKLRGREIFIGKVEADTEIAMNGSSWDAMISFEKNGESYRKININDELTLSEDEKGLVLSLSEECGDGRSVRRISKAKLDNVRILCDESIVEFYINDGEYVMTSRYYPSESLAMKMSVEGCAAEVSAYVMNSGIEIEKSN